MKRTICSLFISFVYAIGVHAASETEKFVLRLLQEPGNKTDLSVVTNENRDAATKLLREIAIGKVTKIGTVLPDNISAEVVLIRLNDGETINRLIESYRANYGSRGSFWLAEHLEWAGQASVIPLLAADFFLEDGNQGRINREGKGGGLRVIPRSAFSGITALRITIASKQFSDETRAWANERLMQDCYPYDKFRAEMRLWWKQNYGAFAKGDYKAVNPLKPEKAVAVIAPPSPLPPTPFPPTATPNITPNPVQKTPAVVQPEPAPPISQRKPAWMWIATIFVLATGGLIAWKRRK